MLRKLQFLGDLITELAESITALEEPATQRLLMGTPAAGVATRLRLLQDRLLSELRIPPRRKPHMLRLPVPGLKSLWKHFAFKVHLYWNINFSSLFHSTGAEQTHGNPMLASQLTKILA